MQRIISHSEPIMSVDISVDGTICATGSLDGTIKIWDLYIGNCIQYIQCDNPNAGVLHLQLLDNKNYVCATYTDVMIRLWDIKTKKNIRLYNIHNNPCITSNFVFFALNFVPFSYTSTHKKIPCCTIIPEFRTDIISPKMVTIIAVGVRGGSIYIIDTNTCEVLQILSPPKSLHSTNNENLILSSLDIHPLNGALLATYYDIDTSSSSISLWTICL